MNNDVSIIDLTVEFQAMYQRGIEKQERGYEI